MIIRPNEGQGGGGEVVGKYVAYYECIQADESGNEQPVVEIEVNGKPLEEYGYVENEDGTRTYTVSYIYESALLECSFNGDESYIYTSTVQVPKDDESLVKVGNSNWSTFVLLESKTEKKADVAVESVYATRTVGADTFTIMANKYDSFKSIYKSDDGEGNVSTNTTDLSNGVYVQYKSEEGGEEVSSAYMLIGDGTVEVCDNLSGVYTSVKPKGIDFNGVMWNFWRGSQDEYDAIEEKDGDTLYVITE